MTHRNPSEAAPGQLPGKLQMENVPECSGHASNLNPRAQNGIDLWEEIETAVSEKDILTLREQLQKISIGLKPENSELEVPFDLSEKLDIPRFLDQKPVVPEELAAIRDPLPKIHVHNHHRAVKETVHQLYKEQSGKSTENEEEEVFLEEAREWGLIGEAIMEKDIMDLRESLQHIVGEEIFSSAGLEEIENYLEGEMSDKARQQFEEEFMVNEQLRSDLQLNRELEEALSEKDIMDLRALLEEVGVRQNSTSRSQKEIEAYLDNQLTESEKASFMEELHENEDLRAAVKLEKEVRASLSENDVIRLRKTLKEIPEEEYSLETKTIIPVHGIKRNYLRVGIVAAVFVFVTGISFVLHHLGTTGDEIMAGFLQPPQSVSNFRSAERTPSVVMEKAFSYYNQADYHNALVYFRKVIESESASQMARFYSGASYQGLNRFENAVSEYNSVVKDNNNIFVEQAEWYRTLCYFKLGKNKTALADLKAIIDKKGYYEKDARLLLKKYRMK